MQLRVIGAIVALLLSSTLTNATPFKLESQGYVWGDQIVGLHYTPTSLNVNVHDGIDRMKVTDAATSNATFFDMLCVDILHTYQDAKLYTEENFANFFTSTVQNKMDALLSHVWDGSFTPDESVALQTAAWKVVWDTSSTNVLSGDLYFTGLTSSVIALANNWLGHLASDWLPTGEHLLYFKPFDPVENQGFVTVSEPSGPMSFLLFGTIAFFLLLFSVRRSLDNLPQSYT